LFSSHFAIQGGKTMLVLSRKAGEEIVIGDNIKVVIGRISGNRVTIGIKAPDDVHIKRGELRVPADQADETRRAEDLVAAM
jgi:carbon storage regulator